MLKANPSGKNSIRCQSYVYENRRLKIYFNSRHACHDSRHDDKCNICAFHEETHAFEDLSFVRLSSLVLASEWITNHKRFIV